MAAIIAVALPRGLAAAAGALAIEGAPEAFPPFTANREAAQGCGAERRHQSTGARGEAGAHTARQGPQGRPGARREGRPGRPRSEAETQGNPIREPGRKAPPHQPSARKARGAGAPGPERMGRGPHRPRSTKTTGRGRGPADQRGRRQHRQRANATTEGGRAPGAGAHTNADAQRESHGREPDERKQRSGAGATARAAPEGRAKPQRIPADAAAPADPVTGSKRGGQADLPCPRRPPPDRAEAAATERREAPNAPTATDTRLGRAEYRRQRAGAAPGAGSPRRERAGRKERRTG